MTYQKVCKIDSCMAIKENWQSQIDNWWIILKIDEDSCMTMVWQCFWQGVVSGQWSDKNCVRVNLLTLILFCSFMKYFNLYENNCILILDQYHS